MPDDIPIFNVNSATNWQPVADHLITQAFASPLSEADSKHYSKSIEEVWRRVAALTAEGRKDATRHSAAVVYHAVTLVSLVLTVEPGIIHLSMVQIIQPPMRGRPHRITIRRLPNTIAFEAAANILGNYEERKEGALPDVRHFYLRKS